jgi:hypothetical protein
MSPAESRTRAWALGTTDSNLSDASTWDCVTATGPGASRRAARPEPSCRAARAEPSSPRLAARNHELEIK